MYICPICRNVLNFSDPSYRCDNGHCFDHSAKGYVNLLVSGKSGIHGDSKEMLLSRREFLSLGHYEPIIRMLAEIVSQNKAEKKILRILDAGCGEGYYTEGLRSALLEFGITPEIYGIDVSKDGVLLAAKRYKACNFAVASVNALPFPDGYFDVIVSLFAPIAEKEFYRTLSSSGTLITVSPSPRHLYGLKTAIYDIPYENEETTFSAELFTQAGKDTISSVMKLHSKDEISNLFKMTPYYHKTDRIGKERVYALDSIETEIGFMFYTFKK